MELESAVFYTNDLSRVVEFYRDLIGLSVDYIQEGRFASFIFDNKVKLGIKQKKEEREVPGSQAIFIAVDNIDEKYSEIKSKNIPIHKVLTVQDWGTNFAVLDPDGNKVEFVERRQ